MIRAWVRGSVRGIGNPPVIVWRAYQRWLTTQGPLGSQVEPQDPDWAGWLIGQSSLHSRRAPGTTCISALVAGVQGTPTHRVNNSKGCGGVMRVAPVGLIADDPFELGCKLAALTHGHPSGFLSAGAFALMIALLYRGESLRTALDHAMHRLAGEPDHDEVLRALQRSVRAAGTEPATPETIERLGGGWVAEEALAIAVFAALTSDGFAEGVLLAVNHSGDSDSTGSMTGNLLGTMLGDGALPEHWVQHIELAEVLVELADDLGRVVDSSDNTAWDSPGEVHIRFVQKYPGV